MVTDPYEYSGAENSYQEMRDHISRVRMHEDKDLNPEYRKTRELILKDRMEKLVKEAPDYVLNLPVFLENREEHVGGQLTILGKSVDYTTLYTILADSVERAIDIYSEEEEVPTDELVVRKIDDIISIHSNAALNEL